MQGKQSRITLRLPQDHPIFNYKPGDRAGIARQWLDHGYHVTSVREDVEAVKQAVAVLREDVGRALVAVQKDMRQGMEESQNHTLGYLRQIMGDLSELKDLLHNEQGNSKIARIFNRR